MKRLKILLLLVLALSCSKRKTEIYERNNVSVKGGPERSPASEPSQSLILQKRMEKGDITSTEALVDSLNAAHPKEQEALQQGIQKGIEWFSKKAVETLTPADLQEYSSLAHIQIQTDRPANRQLLLSYLGSLCNKIDEKYQHGEEPLIQALEYTLQAMDSAMFDGNPEPLIQLGNKLLAKLDPSRTVFSKKTYPTHHSTLYALHQTLVLIKLIAPSQWTLRKKRGSTTASKRRFKLFQQVLRTILSAIMPYCLSKAYTLSKAPSPLTREPQASKARPERSDLPRSSCTRPLRA